MKRKTFTVWLICIALVFMTGLCLAGTNTKITPYGYIKLDASFDEAKTNDGNFVYYVLDQAKKDNEFNMTAKQTRLGLSFQESGSDHPKVTGKVELDFYGGGAENKPNPMLRHAFMMLQYPSWNLLAGQTSDLFAPLNPSTLNYIVLWRCGNTGYRRPQVRLSKDITVGEKGKLSVAASVNRTVGKDQDGEDFGFPTEMGRIAYSHQLFGRKFAVLGISGLLGGERSDLLGKSFETEAVAIDLSLPLSENVSAQGEFYTGQNMGSYLGGIGQGIDRVNKEEIETSGGWGHVAIALNENAKVNLGAGFDDPKLEENDTGNSLDKNVSFFANIIWQLQPAVSLGVEYLGMETTYRDGESYGNNRGQVSFMYHF